MIPNVTEKYQDVDGDVFVIEYRFDGSYHVGIPERHVCGVTVINKQSDPFYLQDLLTRLPIAAIMECMDEDELRKWLGSQEPTTTG